MLYLLARYFRFARASGVAIVFVNKTLWSADSGMVQQSSGKFGGRQGTLAGKVLKNDILKRS